MPSNRVDHACEDCGAVRSIEKKRLKTAKYCKTCSNKHKWDGRRYPSGVAVKRAATRPDVVAAHYRRHCVGYVSAVPAHYDAHIKAGQYAIRGTWRECGVCGRDWFRPYGLGLTKACSEECLQHRIVVEKRSYKSRRRAWVRGAREYENIDPFEVFSRDVWRCQGCGDWTPEELRGTQHDNAPELDHVVPLSAGGAHVMGNVQTLCRVCNQLKSNMSMEQFRAEYL